MTLTLETAQAFFQMQLSALQVLCTTLEAVALALACLIGATLWSWFRALSKPHIGWQGRR